jgi:hypothetical protein
MSASYRKFEPFLAADDASDMLRIAESYGSFGTYADEATSEGLGESLPQRFDAALNYISSGIDGAGNSDDPTTAAYRTNYFRETYAYGDELLAEGIRPFLENPALTESARAIAGAEVIVPAIVYANLLVPGQELAVHTDVPEFLGVNRKNVPQWLLVCMLHSGLFDEYRIPILTCVSWFGAAEGGAFTFYPEGPDGQRQSMPATHNAAILIDTDRFFHGVERVQPDRPEVPPIDRETRLHFLGGDQWQLRQGDTALADYRWSDIRYSISWKAYCFADEDEAERWRSGRDNLELESILAIFEQELRRRGRLGDERPEPNEFAMLMVREFITFPAPSRSGDRQSTA